MRSEGVGPVGRRAAGGLMLAAACLYLLFVALVLLKVRAADDGHLVYALDDSYIQLSLSEQIAHGHYGINPGEFSSPGSSILWPFLLAPFAGHAIHVYVPLILNVLFGLAAVLLLSFAVNRWPPHGVHAGPRGWWLKLLTVVLLMFVANLVSLPFVGMEHVLQGFLSIACAVALTFAWDGGQIPLWGLAAAAIAPMVRYEDLALTLAVALVLAATQHKVRAALLFAVGILPLAAFGLFLRHRGLPMLPTSVLMRGTGSIAPQRNLLETVYILLRNSYHLILDNGDRWPMLALGVLLGFCLLNERNPTRRSILFAGVVLAFLQMAVGPFGFFHRYEVYALIFLTLLFYRAVIDPPLRYAPILLGLFALASPYIAAAGQTASVTQEIYRQQFQMHRFLADYYRKNVAVNDLGLTSYRRAPGVYVLDVVGLASLEAASATDKGAPWLENIVSRHRVGLAVLYPGWFQIPASWIPVGTMCGAQTTQVVGGRCVVFYATSPGSEPEVRDDLLRFVPTLPSGVTFAFSPARKN
jgi:hypothetical protein